MSELSNRFGEFVKSATAITEPPEAELGASDPESTHGALRALDAMNSGRAIRLRSRVAGLAIAGASILTASNFGYVDDLSGYADSDNFYPDTHDACEGYVGPGIDLSIELPKPEEAVVKVSVFEDLSDDEKMEVEFLPDVTNKKSSANKFEPSEVGLLESAEQLATIFSHKVDEFVMPTSGIEVKVYSSTDNPSFTIDEATFDELFHAPLNPGIKMGDTYYAELTDCMQNGFGFPEAQAGEELRIFITPETDYCLYPAAYKKVESDGDREGCISSAGTPPTIKVEVGVIKSVTLLEINFMILTFNEQANHEELEQTIAELLAHEAGHYWYNQMGIPWQLDQEERYISALEKTIDGNFIDENTGSPINYTSTISE